MKKRIGWFLYALLLMGVCLPLLWARGVFLPRGTSHTKEETFAGGTPITLTLAGSRFTAVSGEKTLWQSGPGLHVQDYLSMDIDRDGSTELLLLVWRRGNYGSSRPFWVERNDTRWSQHIFIYDYDPPSGSFVPLWMSSQLRPEVARWSVSSSDELFILTPDGDETLWQWGQWGLVRTDMG